MEQLILFNLQMNWPDKNKCTKNKSYNLHYKNKQCTEIILFIYKYNLHKSNVYDCLIY